MPSLRKHDQTTAQMRIYLLRYYLIRALNNIQQHITAPPAMERNTTAGRTAPDAHHHLAALGEHIAALERERDVAQMAEESVVVALRRKDEEMAAALKAKDEEIAALDRTMMSYARDLNRIQEQGSDAWFRERDEVIAGLEEKVKEEQGRVVELTGKVGMVLEEQWREVTWRDEKIVDLETRFRALQEGYEREVREAVERELEELQAELRRLQ